ncbi:MAG: hypothetical protein UZ16_OP3001002370 [Candidatus Hinthialibacteria bacterium OLB16]|nr:MAG: hypothetical protein UZ16_OP3001002370 [Candidatus Hinthialibacteria bacterium OLB16]
MRKRCQGGMDLIDNRAQEAIGCIPKIHQAACPGLGGRNFLMQNPGCRVAKKHILRPGQVMDSALRLSFKTGLAYGLADGFPRQKQGVDPIGKFAALTIQDSE